MSYHQVIVGVLAALLTAIPLGGWVVTKWRQVMLKRAIDSALNSVKEGYSSTEEEEVDISPTTPFLQNLLKKNKRV